MTPEKFEMMDPMRYYDNPEPNTPSAIQKRDDMISNKDGLYIASEKHDGDWGMFIHYSKGHNLIRSRSISKVTGAYGVLTEKLPHLVEEMDAYWPDNTVVLAEICWDEYGTDANSVGTILRCLPPKAVERQKSKKLVGYAFDLLMYDGQDMTSEPYISRLWNLEHFINAVDSDFKSHYFKLTQLFSSDFAEAADEIISKGGEGVVIQLKSNPYMPGTRSAWKTLKLKKTLPHMDLKVIATIEPEKYYKGDCPESWQFKCGDELVTKPYYYGWKNGIIVDFNGVEVSVTSGLTDADREWLASENAAKAIANGELWAEVKAMAVNAKDSLRHPALVRLRTDM